MLLYPLFTPILTKFWFTTLGLPSVLDYSTTLKNFFESTLPYYYNEFREFTGCSKIYYERPAVATYNWEANWLTLDPENRLGLHNLSKEEQAFKIRRDLTNIIIPDLITTYKMKNDPALWSRTYNIEDIKVYPYNSPLELSFIHSLFNYQLGLSLACIVFVITIILTLLYALNFFTGLSMKDSEKLSPYECGFDPIHSNARIKFDILYWIIGILYLIFDLEIIFIFPLATILHNLINPVALLAYLFFMIILTLGFVYEWTKGALKLNL
jgi:NADH-quinone oxidoreductase subunit A